jgi:hypothetical protein
MPLKRKSLLVATVTKQAGDLCPERARAVTEHALSLFCVQNLLGRSVDQIGGQPTSGPQVYSWRLTWAGAGWAGAPLGYQATA